MKLVHCMLPLAIAASLAATNAHAEIPIDVIAGAEVGFEGLLQTDGNWYSSDVANLDGDGADGGDADFGLRRAELVLKGKGPGNFDWVAGYDAKAGKWLDANLRYRIGGSKTHTLTFGQFKQANSLEELSSTKHNDFIAKAAITNTWAVGRRVGIGYGIAGDAWAMQASYFGKPLTPGGGTGTGFAVRGSLAPIKHKEQLLHLGLSYANYAADQYGKAATQRWRVRPQADLAGVRLLDTGTLPHTDKVQTLGIEAFWTLGPFKLQGEYMRSTTTRDGFDDFNGNGGYVSAVWNLTGERWKYKNGTAGTPLPTNPASGMWQLGLRYDRIDLNDGHLASDDPTLPIVGVLGGEMKALTLGANWYLRSNFKLALNHVRVSSSKYDATTATHVSDDPAITEIRAQFFW